MIALPASRLTEIRASHGEPELLILPSMRVILGLLCAALLLACGSDHFPDAEKKVVSLDLLGILHEDFPCEKYLEEMRDATEINLGYLAGNTFGRERVCIRQILSDPRLTKLRVHITSWPCVRNNRCHPGESLAGVTGGNDGSIPLRIRKYAEEELNHMGNELHDRTRIFISPILEHEVDANIFEAGASEIQSLSERVTYTFEIVENPLLPRPSKYLLEVHNEFASPQFPYLFSTDGYFGPNPGRLISQNESAEIKFLWRPGMNGLCTDGSPWVFPTERRCW